MPKSDPFESPKRQLRRGKRNINALKKSFDAFLKKVKYVQLIEPDSDGVHQLVKFRFSRRVPKSWDDSIHVILEALRSALDQIGYSVAKATGHPTPKSCYFPIANSPNELENVIKGRCKDLPKEIVALFCQFQPYKGGNDSLWALNKLRHSFHTAIIPAKFFAGGMVIDHIYVLNPTVDIRAPRYDPAKNEVLFARLGPAGKMDYKINFAFTITLDQIDILRGKPLFSILHTMTTAVESILLATEAECRKLKIII